MRRIAFGLLSLLLLLVWAGQSQAATHRYWRVMLVANPGNGSMSFLNIQFRTTHNGSNAATGGTASADQTFGGTSITNAFANTGLWSGTNGSNTANGQHWVEYDLGSGNSAAMVEVFIKARTDCCWSTQTPTDIAFQYSDDNSTWTNLFYGIVTAGWTSGSTVTFTLPAAFVNGGSYQGWGVHMSTSDQSCCLNAFSMQELELNIGGSDQAPGAGGTAFASETNASNVASNAFDGVSVTTTIWSGNDQMSPATQTLTYFFTSALALTSIGLTSRNDGSYPQTPHTFDFVYSTDGITWAPTGVNETASTWSQNTTQTFSLPAAAVVGRPVIPAFAANDNGPPKALSLKAAAY